MVGISNARTREGKSQRGPTVRASGRAVYSLPLASTAMRAGQRGSGVGGGGVSRPVSSYASLPHPLADGSMDHGAPDPAPGSRPSPLDMTTWGDRVGWYGRFARGHPAPDIAF